MAFIYIYSYNQYPVTHHSRTEIMSLISGAVVDDMCALFSFTWWLCVFFLFHFTDKRGNGNMVVWFVIHDNYCIGCCVIWEYTDITNPCFYNIKSNIVKQIKLHFFPCSSENEMRYGIKEREDATKYKWQG